MLLQYSSSDSDFDNENAPLLNRDILAADNRVQARSKVQVKVVAELLSRSAVRSDGLSAVIKIMKAIFTRILSVPHIA